MASHPVRGRSGRQSQLAPKHHILIVGSGKFAARLAPAFSPRQEFEVKRVSSISTDLILEGVIPELAILDGDALRHESFLLLDALSRFEAAVPVVVISSHPEFFRVTAAMKVVTPRQARIFLAGRGRRLLNHQQAGAGGRSHVPLGITADHVAIGSHIGFVWRTDADLRRLFRFWVPSEPAAQLVLAAPSGLLDRLCSLLTRFGMNSRALIASGKLVLVEGEQLTHVVVKHIVSFVSRAARRGAWPVRIIAFCAGHKGRHRNRKQELELDHALFHLPAVLVCTYRIDDCRADDFLEGPLTTHRSMVIGDSLFENSFYLP